MLCANGPFCYGTIQNKISGCNLFMEDQSNFLIVPHLKFFFVCLFVLSMVSRVWLAVDWVSWLVLASAAWLA